MAVSSNLSRRSRSGRFSVVRPLDQLEARTLFSVATFPDVNPGFGGALTTDNAGNIYVTSPSNSGILKFHKNADGSASSQQLLDAGDGFPTDVVFDAATSKLYFTTDSRIGEMNTDGSGLQYINVTDPTDGFVEAPVALAVASDGSVWYGTAQDANDGLSLLGRLAGGDMSNPQQTSIPFAQQAVTSIAAGSNGSVWIVAGGLNDGTTVQPSSISNVTVSSSGAFTFSKTTQVLSGNASIGGIAQAADGSVWTTVDTFVDFSGNASSVPDQLQHVTFDSSGNGTITSVTIPKNAGEGATLPEALTIDSTGKLWFTETDSDSSGAPVAGLLSSYNPASGQFDREIIPDAMMGNAYRISIVNGATGPTDALTVTQDGVVADESIAQVTAGFSISGSNVAGTEDVALAANVAGVSTPVVGTFSGPAGSYTVSIAWSDGTTSAGRIATGSNGQQYIALASGTSKTFATQGSYTGTITVSDGVTSHTATAVANIAPALSATQGVQLKPVIAKLVLGNVTTFTSAISAPASAFTASINWGDGTTSSGVIIRNPANPAQYFVLGLHNYHLTGTYTITTTVRNVSLNEVTTGTAVVHV